MTILEEFIDYIVYSTSLLFISTVLFAAFISSRVIQFNYNSLFSLSNYVCYYFILTNRDVSSMILCEGSMFRLLAVN